MLTNLKAAEEHSRYKELLENVDDAVYILDHKGNVLEANEAAYSQIHLAVLRRLEELCKQRVFFLDLSFKIPAYLIRWLSGWRGAAGNIKLNMGITDWTQPNQQAAQLPVQ